MVSWVLELAGTVARLPLIAWVLARAWLRIKLRRAATEDEVYRAVVRLGPTAIKLAQVASTRPDLVPAAIARRLESLQEAAPKFSFEQVRRCIEHDLGGSLERRFAAFPETPIAAASLSQVYFATLADGTPVAVKVQRPGIRRRIARDVRILRWLARVLTIVRPGLRNLRLPAAVGEFGRWTMRELDFRVEGANADELRQNFAGWPDVWIPRVYWSHTARRVLTMERVDGRRVKQVVGTVAADERRRLVRRVAAMIMKMFVDDGFFHADLHPGNIFFADDGRIILLDVGMVGRMDRDQTARFLAYWVAVARKQRQRAFHHLLALAQATDGADLVGYRAAYEEILDEFDGSTVAEKSLARTYLDVVQRGARSGVVFPSEMLIQAKSLVTMEALCLFMDPEFRFSEEMRPIVARLAAERVAPARLVDRLWSVLPDWLLVGEWIEAEPGPRHRASETAFRWEVAQAVAERWADEADAPLARLSAIGWAGGTAAQDRPWLAAMPAAMLPVGRLALARLEEAVRRRRCAAEAAAQSREPAGKGSGARYRWDEKREDPRS